MRKVMHPPSPLLTQKVADALRGSEAGQALIERGRRLLACNPFRYLPDRLKCMLLIRSGLIDEHHSRYAHSRHTASGTAGNSAEAEDSTQSALSALFDAAWYRQQYGVCGSDTEVMLHYAYLGDRLGFRPSPWFDPHLAQLDPAFRTGRGSSLSRYCRGLSQTALPNSIFDTNWYLECYIDVRDSGINPLLHYVLYGRMEGRKPSEYFDPNWYANTYADVTRSGMDPSLHYLLHGSREGRSPGPEFDAAIYTAHHPEVRASRLDALGYYRAFGRRAGHTLACRSINVHALAPRERNEIELSGGVVDIVLPVYRGMAETRACLESVLASHGRTRVRLHVINDASPEPELSKYLRSVATSSLSLDLRFSENDVNLGFVRTVNRGIRAAIAEHDSIGVILLNSDTLVHGDWVDRLVAHAQLQRNIASVTALSNNATICSFPRLGGADLPEDVDAASIDALASAVNAGQAVEVPTGVGFCMFISREALETVGLLDEAAFGKGYGEENDFCMRAKRCGFRNLLAMDVFVVHVGEVSFSADSAPGKQAADRIIRQRYPEYHAEVAGFVESDPGLVHRLRLIFALWRLEDRKLALVVTHALGGGTERHVQEVASKLSVSGPVLVMRPVAGHATRVSLENRDAFDGFCAEVDVVDPDGFAQLLRYANVHSLQIHHVLGYGSVLREGIAIAGASFEFIVHDYFSICPQVTLTTPESKYCKEPDERGCDICIQVRPSHGAVDIRNWRLAREWLVLGAASVRAPSMDAAQRIERYFGRRPEFVPHEPAPIVEARLPEARTTNRGNLFRVVVIGALAAHKGRQAVLDAARAAYERKLPLTFHLIGDPLGDVPGIVRKRLTWTGWYKEEQLPDLMVAADPDCFLFAAQSPETYSYTLTAAMQTGLPIVATNIGAFPERLRTYPYAMPVAWSIDGAALADALHDFLLVLTGEARKLREKGSGRSSQ